MEATFLLAGLGSAASAAVSTSLQHHAAVAAPRKLARPSRLLLYLLRRPRWLVAQALSLAAFALHAVALRAGALVVVQPIVVSGMVLAVPVRAALSRRVPGSREVGAVVVTAAGLSVFLVASRPGISMSGHGSSGDGGTALALTAAGFLVAALGQHLAARHFAGRRRAAMYGAAAGVLFGLLAGLLKLTVGMVQEQGLSEVLTAWWPWALVCAGVGGAVVNQRAYRAGTLSASMPVLNIVDVLVGQLFGLVVFREVPAHSVGAGIAQCLGLGCVAVGLRLLARLPEPGAEFPL